MLFWTDRGDLRLRLGPGLPGGSCFFPAAGDGAPVSISLIGGGGREVVWCQLLADVLDHDITVLGDTEFRAAQALAALARRGTGTGLAEDGTVYRPRSQYRALYDAQYARYQKLYPALQGL